MCGLYSFRKSVDEARALFKYLEQPIFPPREYVTPGSPIAIVRTGLDHQRHFELVRWGFVPSWAKEIQPRPLINARSETVSMNGKAMCREKSARILFIAQTTVCSRLVAFGNIGKALMALNSKPQRC
jgi:putative SOS response-associated peptidase YedK